MAISRIELAFSNVMISIICGSLFASNTTTEFVTPTIILPSSGWTALALISRFIGSKDTAGSAGAKASNTNSVISASLGRVHPAPVSLFGFNRLECGLEPSKKSFEPNIPSPLQSNKLIPISEAVRIGSSISKPSLPFTLNCKETFDKSAPGANSNCHSVVP